MLSFPAYNEEAVIEKTLSHLIEAIGEHTINEIILVDGGSTDKTINKAEQFGAQVIQPGIKSRAMQMNAGAKAATGNVLLFLHADTVPPKLFLEEIYDALNEGFCFGSYRLKFDYDHWFLKLNCWFTRFNINNFRFGDQGLFVMKNVFEEAGGFNENLLLMEDQELFSRLTRLGKCKVMKGEVITSARKYKENGVFKTQAIFFLIYFMYKLGFSHQMLCATYKKLIKQDKI